MIHFHTDAILAVACQRNGLLPPSQNALIVMPFLAYHDYEWLAFRLDKRVAILRNHGAFVVGASPAEACLAPADRRMGGRQALGFPSVTEQDAVAQTITAMPAAEPAELVWPA